MCSDNLKRIIEKDDLFLTVNDIAPIIGSNPSTIRETAQLHPELIRFPFMFCGSAMKIPKVPFLKFLGVEK